MAVAAVVSLAAVETKVVTACAFSSFSCAWPPSRHGRGGWRGRVPSPDARLRAVRATPTAYEARRRSGQRPSASPSMSVADDRSVVRVVVERSRSRWCLTPRDSPVLLNQPQRDPAQPEEGDNTQRGANGLDDQARGAYRPAHEGRQESGHTIDRTPGPWSRCLHMAANRQHPAAHPPCTPIPVGTDRTTRRDTPRW